MHIIAAKAVAFGEALQDEFFTYAMQLQKNANAMADAFVKRGYNIISGGTDNHMMLIDLRNKGISGKEAENALEQAKLRRFIAREANAVLVAAKGTQTEGDAQRAYDMIMSGLDKNSNTGVQGALEDLKTMKENTVKGLSTYVDSMKTKGKGTSGAKPTAPTQTPSQTIAAIRAANPGLENYTDAQILEAARKQKQSK